MKKVYLLVPYFIIFLFISTANGADKPDTLIVFDPETELTVTSPGYKEIDPTELMDPEVLKQYLDIEPGKVTEEKTGKRGKTFQKRKKIAPEDDQELPTDKKCQTIQKEIDKTKYKKVVTELTKIFNFPQNESCFNITKEEEKNFIETIATTCSRITSDRHSYSYLLNNLFYLPIYHKKGKTFKELFEEAQTKNLLTITVTEYLKYEAKRRSNQRKEQRIIKENQKKKV